MLSAPGSNTTIVSVPTDGITITKFHDDKGGEHSTALYHDQASHFGYGRRTLEGQQVLVNLPLTAAPTPGATTCSIAGNLEVKVARGDRVASTEKIDLRKGRSVTAGPYELRVIELRQVAPETPGPEWGAVEAMVELTGPIARARSVELVDASSGDRPLATRTLADESSWPAERGQKLSFALRLSKAPDGPVIARVHHYDSDETMRVPFDITTGVGL